MNGCASAGKSTLAKAIQELSKEKFLYIGIDTLFGALPRKIVGSDQKAEAGFRYVIDPKTGDLIEMKVSPYARLVFSCLPKVVKLLADNGLNVIFDECNLATMEQREKSRGDRVIGMTKIFYKSEKNFQFPYDLIVDTTSESPFDNSQKILKFLKENKTQASTKNN